jgi:hypothetical protein
MNPRITSVKPQQNYHILLTFDNSEIRLFDMNPYIKKGFFKQLQNEDYFKKVKPFLGSVQWENGQDLCPDMLYLESKKY